MSVYCIQCGRFITQMCGEEDTQEVEFDICTECNQNQQENKTTEE